MPLNVDGEPQSAHATTPAEFLQSLKTAGISLPTDKAAAIITHCGSGGRGGKAQAILHELGHTNVHNGGSPAHIAAALYPSFLPSTMDQGWRECLSAEVRWPYIS